jgi:transposase
MVSDITEVTAAMLAPLAWYVAVQPIDLRCGMDRLLLLVKSALGRDGFDGSAYVFRNRAGNRIKVVCVDATGVWLCMRRLHDGSFHWPRARDVVMALSVAQMSWLQQGVDWQRLSARLDEVRTQL